MTERGARRRRSIATRFAMVPALLLALAGHPAGAGDDAAAAEAAATARSGATAVRGDDLDSLSRSLAELLGGRPSRQEPEETEPEPEPQMPVIAAPREGSANAFLPSGLERMPEMPALQGIGGLAVVVELFTSQGCSNCPPADAMMAALDSQPDVLPLAFHVDYWDYLGWADSFAQPAFTERQQRYAYAAGERSLYTPQVIVDGQDTALSLRPAELMALVDAHRATPALISVVSDGEPGRQRIELQPLSDLAGPLAVMLVHYLPQREVAVTAGENRGKVVRYRNIVVGIDLLAQWNGAEPVRLTFDEAAHIAGENLPDDVRHAVLIQQMEGSGGLPGPILGALRLN